VLPALTQNGVIYADVRQGAYDGASFIQFIQGLLPYMNPWPERHSVLVMDNCQIHQVDQVVRLCE
ncbi:hypothetical protein M422DRAFT_125351, partial [Sphaerobolus stellatus SS14]